MNDRFGSTARDFAAGIVTREGGTPEDVRESSPVRTWTVSRPITALNSTGTRFRAWAPASATGMRSNSPTTRWA